MRRLFSFFLLLLLPAAAPAQDALTLRDAVRIALDQNYGAQRARSAVDAAEASARSARSAQRPQLDLTAQVYYNEPDAVFPFGDIEVSVLPQDDWDVQIALRQNLWSGGRLRAAIEQADLGAGSARDALRRTTEELLIRVTTNFLVALRGQSLVEIETQGLELAQDRLRRAENLFEAGEVTQVDILRAKASIKDAERRLVEANRLLASSLSFLRADLAVDRDAQLRLQPPEGPALAALPDEDILLQSALDVNPTIAEARKQYEQARLAGEIARGLRRPTVDLQGVFTRQKRNFPSDTIGSLSLALRVPIYTGGALAAEIDIAGDRERSAESALAEVRVALGEKVRRALLDLAAAEAKLALSEEQLVLVAAEHEQVVDLYEALELTSLDLQQAELSLTVARRRVLSSRIDLILAQAAVWLVAGRLEEALLQENVL